MYFPRKTLQEIKEFSRKHNSKADSKVLDDLDERQIKEILKDASLGKHALQMSGLWKCCVNENILPF